MIESTMSDLYEGDILLWSERRAELLRRRAAGALSREPDRARRKRTAHHAAGINTLELRWMALRFAYGFDLENLKRELIEKLRELGEKEPP
jgi:hypothetical protein